MRPRFFWRLSTTIWPCCDTFAANAALATYLTVVARRVVVRKMAESRSATPLGDMVAQAEADECAPEQRISDQEEIGRLLSELRGSEATAVRMYHLEGKSYQEISRSVGMPVNSVGPMLSRARANSAAGPARIRRRPSVRFSRRVPVAPIGGMTGRPFGRDCFLRNR